MKSLLVVAGLIPRDKSLETCAVLLPIREDDGPPLSGADTCPGRGHEASPTLVCCTFFCPQRP